MSEARYLCNKCKNKVFLSKIRYDTNGTELICEDCYNTKKSKLSIRRDENSEENHSIKSNERIKVICTDCRYKFSIRYGSRISLRCPYCGNNKLVRDQTSVDEIIKEVSDYSGEYN